ncbi:MAG: hypothetical protein OXU66_11180 [Gammaproteobacteria bacterium]|nr:hypothetical protein [Gammaproteobacteria bacterium]
MSTVWGIIDVPDRPFVLAVMSNYGGNGGEVIEKISSVTYDYFSRLSGITDFGTRVPLELKNSR